MQTLTIDVTKIPRDCIYVGKKGKYITITLMENKNGTDQYGNDGFAVLDIGKERRQAGEKGPIIGNWKDKDRQQASSEKAKAPAPKGDPVEPPWDADDESEIPF